MPISDFVVSATTTSYAITNWGTSTVIDVASGALVLDAPTGISTQQWQLIYRGEDQFCLANASTNACIGIDATGAQVSMGAYSGSEAQIWQLVTPGGSANVGPCFLYNNLYGTYLTAQGTGLVLDAAQVVDEFHQWLFNAADPATLQVFNQNSLLSTVTFYLASSAGQYVAVGLQLDEQTYAIVSVQATDSAAVFTIGSDNVITTTAPDGSVLYLGEAFGEPVFTTAASSWSASFMLFNDELTYIRFQDGSYLSLNPSSSQGALVLQPSQFFPGAAFDVVPEAMAPGADLSRFSLPEEVIVTRVDISQLDPCTLAWITLLWQCTGGLLMAVGILPSIANAAMQSTIYNAIVGNATVYSAAQAVVSLIQSNPKMSAALFTLVNELLIQMYNQGLLMPIIKSLISTLGWFALVWLAKKVIIWIFAPQAEVANILVGSIAWGISLVQAGLNVNTSCSSLPEGELPQLVPAGAG
ncbi:MAG TPA: RICIN domain-containing protein [Thermoanaerobaculia bacterium]|nr:RICIN domain-containing protein [Thermoanaerobaculia bacterium]